MATEDGKNPKFQGYNKEVNGRRNLLTVNGDVKEKRKWKMLILKKVRKDGLLTNDFK